MRGTGRHTRGSALVEMTLLMPLVIAVIYGSLYLADLGLFKLKGIELARYEAWGLATRQLTQWSTGETSNNFATVRDSVRDEVHNLYVDLDGATAGQATGVSRMTAGAQLVQLSNADLTSASAPMMGAIGSAAYIDELSFLGQIAKSLGLGPSLDAIVATTFMKMGFNGDGLVTGRASLAVSLPWVANDATRALLIAQAGASRGADLSGWSPVNAFILGDRDGEPMQTTVLADSWRLDEGRTSQPHATSAYRDTVRRMQRKLPDAFPFSGLFSLLFSDMHENLTVVSRPYISARDANESANGSTAVSGQVNVFGMAGRQVNESGAVQNFETGALWDDPNDKANSPYLRELNARGPNFMGCAQAETRGCR